MRGECQYHNLLHAAVIVLYIFFVESFWVAYKLNKKKGRDTSGKKSISFAANFGFLFS